MTGSPWRGWRLRTADPTPDGELLRRFHGGADQDAFELLVHRHAPVVLRVCRAVARDPHLAEDAAQAVFLVLARRAGRLVEVRSLPAWLVRVAYRIAARARGRAPHPHAPLAAAATVASSDPDPAAAAAVADLAAIAIEEVHRLPERYHAPIVLCVLKGLSQTEAADQLGWRPGTVAGRLARAKLLLRDRLARRGIPATAVAAAILGGSSASAVPSRFAAGVIAAALGPTGPTPTVNQLVQETTLAMTPLISRGPVWVAAGLLVTATVALALAAGDPQTDPPSPKRAPATAPADQPQARGPNRIIVDRGGHLTLIDPDGRNEKRIDEELAKSLARDGRLSPDGKRVAFLVAADPPGDAPGRHFLTNFRLHVRDVGGKGLGTDLGPAKASAWSPDGTEIAATDFTATDGLPDKLKPDASHFVVNVRTEAKAALKLPDDHIITDWSRDGKYFVTTRLRGTKDAPSARVFLMNRDGTEHKAVTDGKAVAVGGRLSPDGRRVLYAEVELPVGKPPAPGKLVVADLVAGTTTPVGGIPQDAEVQSYCWSPDGKRVAYTWGRTINDGTTQAETEAAVVVCDPDGANEKTVLAEKLPSKAGTLLHIDWR